MGLANYTFNVRYTCPRGSERGPQRDLQPERCCRTAPADHPGRRRLLCRRDMQQLQFLHTQARQLQHGNYSAATTARQLQVRGTCSGEHIPNRGTMMASHHICDLERAPPLTALAGRPPFLLFSAGGACELEPSSLRLTLRIEVGFNVGGQYGDTTRPSWIAFTATCRHQR